MLALSGMQRWVRPGVFIDATTIKEDAQGLGAFAPRGGITRKSSFLGVYRATNWRVQKRRYSGNNDYVMQCGDWLAMPQGRICKRKGRVIARLATPDLGMYPICAVQEPPAGTTANCHFVAFYTPRSIGVAGSFPIECVALYAARDLQSGEELFVHYGDSKTRSYDVGTSAPPVFKKDIPDNETPGNWLPPGMPALADGWRRRA